MQPFTHQQQLYLNEVQENIRVEVEALKAEIREIKVYIATHHGIVDLSSTRRTK